MVLLSYRPLSIRPASAMAWVMVEKRETRTASKIVNTNNTRVVAAEGSWRRHVLYPYQQYGRHVGDLDLVAW